MIDTLFGKSVKSLVPRFQKGHSSQTCVIPELNLTLNFVDNILNTFSGDYEIGKLIKKYIGKKVDDLVEEVIVKAEEDETQNEKKIDILFDKKVRFSKPTCNAGPDKFIKNQACYIPEYNLTISFTDSVLKNVSDGPPEIVKKVQEYIGKKIEDLINIKIA